MARRCLLYTRKADNRAARLECPLRANWPLIASAGPSLGPFISVQQLPVPWDASSLARHHLKQACGDSTKRKSKQPIFSRMS